MDASGHIYTGCTYGTFWGNCIEKWKPTGVLQWRLFAGTSLDSAGLDPDHDTEVYSQYHHYSLDYSKTILGTEWTLKGFSAWANILMYRWCPTKNCPTTVLDARGQPR